MWLATRLTTSLCKEVRLTVSAKKWAPVGARSQKPSGQHFALGAFDVDTTFGSEAPKGLATVSLQMGAHWNLLPLSDFAGVSLATTRRLHIWLNCGVNSPEASKELSWLRHRGQRTGPSIGSRHKLDAA
jgi:hypothetical protein